MDDRRITFLLPPRKFFEDILRKSNWEELQKDTGVSRRTLRAWRAGENTIPYTILELLVNKYKIEVPPHTITLIKESRRSAGRIGGFARQAKYGNPGTPEGRSRGGKKSIETHKKNFTSPFVPRQVLMPVRSVDLAELIGVLLGDGGITQYQFIITSNSLEEVEYVKFLSGLVERVFAVTPTTFVEKNANAIKTICSRAQAVQYLQAEGLKLGNKVKQQVDVPAWIKEDLEYTKACLRGLIDTDGCVYIDHHKIKARDYFSLGIAFTNASMPLLDFVERSWITLGFTPTRWGRHVRLRKRGEVLAYAKSVGFSNPKHVQKINV